MVIPSGTRNRGSATLGNARDLLAVAEAAFGGKPMSLADDRSTVASSASGSRSVSKSYSGASSRIPKFFDDDSKTTFRNGIAGDHYEIGAALVDCSSSESVGGAHWASKVRKDGQETAEEFCIYDLGERTVLTEVNMKFEPDSEESPQCVHLSYCSADHLKQIKAGMADFISVKRSYVAKDAERLHMGFRCEDAARFWKLCYPMNWGGARTVVKKIQFVAEDVASRKMCNGLKQMSYEHSSQLGRLCSIFDEKETLTDAQLEVRALARKHGIPLGDAETLRLKFEKYDEDRSGHISKDEFSNILAELIRVKVAGDIPQERFNHYWREVDTDQSGEISFEEFLIWYTSIVKTGALNPKSFYAAFGKNRVRNMVENGVW
ncbi:unnamed protein product [Amoebophrya sp. A25]|nr:unnamed protein product [Amoebophrya sp. A25]|eukprot:GSA25T00026962001.1